MNKTIYNKVKGLGLATILLLTASFMVSCSQDSDGIATNPTQNKLRFEIYDGGTITRSTTDAQSLTTVFAEGDQAGLYIVKGGEVKYANVVLTYNSLGEWEAAAPITATADMTGAQFYAYYPYSDEVTFDVTAANPLKAWVDGIQPAENQSSQEKFERGDVMVANASTIGSKNTVSLALQHQKALVYIELPNNSYTFDNEGMEPYVLAQAENAKFTLNGTEVKPYQDPASQSYRLIVNPGQTGTMKVTFTDDGNDRHYDITQLSQLTAGQYAKYIIDGGVKLTHYGTLQIGDYFCADGTLVSKDTPAGSIPSNVTGVIYRIGTTDGLKAANSKWSHAMGISLQEPASKAKWGSTKGTDGNWYTAYGLEIYRKITSESHEVEMPDNGYQATKAWLSIPTDAAEATFVVNMRANIEVWKDDHAMPTSSTGWYIPSLRDWKTIESLYDTILQEQIVKVGGTEFNWNDANYRNRRYWSSQLRDSKIMLPYAGKTAKIDERYAGIDLNTDAYYRFAFAF